MEKTTLNVRKLGTSADGKVEVVVEAEALFEAAEDLVRQVALWGLKQMVSADRNAPPPQYIQDFLPVLKASRALSDVLGGVDEAVGKVALADALAEQTAGGHA